MLGVPPASSQQRGAGTSGEIRWIPATPAFAGGGNRRNTR